MTAKIALIPAYEPDTRFPELTKNVKDAGFDVVVVDDGSAKDKADIFRQAGEYATVLTHEHNKGKGAALKTGLTYIQTRYRKDYVVVTMDADGQHTTKDAMRVAREAELHKDTLVLGARSREGKNIPLRSRLGNGITRAVFRLSTGLDVYDTQTGLRGFSDELVPGFLTLEGDRYEYEMNVLLYCARAKVPTKEIPIQTIYEDGNKCSHFNALKDSARIYKEILKFAGSSFVSFLVDYGMFGLLSLITGAAGLAGSAGVIVSNVGARAVSSSVNFTINRKLVFKSKKNVAVAALQYFSLVVCILAGNTFLLSALVSLGVNRYLAKMVTEITFFTISWTVQKLVIFRKKEDKKSENNGAALPEQSSAVRTV